MNTIFEDLMYQAGLTASGSFDMMDKYDQDAIENLCRLIVKECIYLADKNSKENIGEIIKNHFGL